MSTETRLITPTPMGSSSPQVAPAPSPDSSPGLDKDAWAKATGQDGAEEKVTPAALDPNTRFGALETPEFVPITVNGIRVKITRIPLHAVHAGTLVFPPFTLLQAIAYAEKHGLSLPTGKTLDAAAEQGWYHAYQSGFYDVGKTVQPGGMNAADTIAEMGRRWTGILKDAPSDKPVANVGKAWLLDAIGVSKPGYAVNHGWYDAKGVPVQNKGRRHTASYTDVSQMGTFVQLDTSDGNYLDLAAKGAFGDAPVAWSDFVKAAKSTTALGGMPSGQVVSYNANKHMGLIVSSDEELLPFREEYLPVGTAVTFTTAEGAAGRYARDVRAIGGVKDVIGDLLNRIAAFFSSASIRTPRYQVRAWKGSELWTDGDIRRLVQIADDVKINPADILLVHLSETGGNPFAKNPLGAVGLIQWTDGTAKMLGSSAKAIGDMTLAQQLDLLEKHAQRFWKGRGIRNAADLYLLNATGGKVCKEGEGCYEGNKVWDVNHDGTLDKSDLGAQLNKVWRQRFGADLPLRSVY